MLWHYGEWIDKQGEVLVNMLLHLFGWAVLLAQETWTLGYSLLLDVGTSRHDACRIELQLERNLATSELARLHITKVVEVMSGIVPYFELSVEETLQRTVGSSVGVAGRHLLSGGDFESAQTVLVEVVGVLSFDAQGCIAIAVPTSAQIQFVEDATYAVFAREGKTEGVILAVACIG